MNDKLISIILLDWFELFSIFNRWILTSTFVSIWRWACRCSSLVFVLLRQSRHDFRTFLINSVSSWRNIWAVIRFVVLLNFVSRSVGRHAVRRSFSISILFAEVDLFAIRSMVFSFSSSMFWSIRGLLESLSAIRTQILILWRLVNFLQSFVHYWVFLLNHSFIRWHMTNFMIAGFIFDHAFIRRFC